MQLNKPCVSTLAIAHSNLLKRLVPSLLKEQLIHETSSLSLKGNVYPFSRDLATVSYSDGSKQFSFNNALEFLHTIKTEVQNELAESFSEKQWLRFIEEMENCITNDAQFIDYRIEREAEILKELNETNTSFISWLKFQRGSAQEQFAAVGHPTHPGYKVKFGLNRDELYAYSPEFDAQHDIEFIALSKELAEVHCCNEEQSLSAIQAMIPNLDKQWQEEAKHLMIDSNDYVLIPIHPWQKKHILQQKFSKLIDSGKLIILQNVKTSASPTLSMRTLELSESQSLHVKIPITALMTSAMRSIPPSNIHNGPLFSDYIHQILKLENNFDNKIAFVRDLCGVILTASEINPYDDTRHLCALYREDPHSLITEDETIINLANLFIISPQTQRPILLDLIEDEYGDLAEASIVDFFNDYVDLLFQTQLKLYLKYGVALEAHQQNSFIVLKDKAISKLIVRDSSDIEFYEPLLDRTRLVYQAHFKTYQITKDRDSLRKTLIHTMFNSNLFFVIDILSPYTSRTSLIQIIKEQLKLHMAEAKTYMAVSEFEQEHSALLESESWAASCLLRMRLADTEKHISIESVNPLLQ